MSSWFTQKRMAFIRRKLERQGWITRQTLIDKFQVSGAQATLDFRALKAAYPELMAYNTKSRRYEVK